MFEWMAWTTPVAVFFVWVGRKEVVMTVWEINAPTSLRRGFLPLETTRGDRLFIGLLTAAYANLAFVGVSGKIVVWMGLDSEPSIWISFVLSMGLLALIMRKG